MSLDRRTEGKVVKEKSSHLGPVSVSLLVHLVFMVVIGSVVIIEQVIPKTSFKPAVLGENFDQQATEEAENPDETLPDPGASATPELPVDTEPQTASVENSMDVTAVETPSTSSWMVASGPAVGAVGKTGSSGGGGTAATGAGKGPRMNPFGNLTQIAGALQGTFYDLKQTPDRKPSGMDRTKYLDLMREFDKKNWDPKLFAGFYKASQPVYTTQIFIPLQTAGGAPKAFNVEKEVKPEQWIILYEGTFSAPATDKYRFVGSADDVLIVRINGETVLDGSRATMNDEKNPLAKVPKQVLERGHKAGNGVLAYGKWLDLEKGAPQKIEVLLGECPGGFFCAFLMVEAKSKEYKKDASGRPVLPLFQLAESEMDFSTEIGKQLAPSYDKVGLLMGAGK